MHRTRMDIVSPPRFGDGPNFYTLVIGIKSLPDPLSSPHTLIQF
jgi:hypothetical protein